MTAEHPLVDRYTRAVLAAMRASPARIGYPQVGAELEQSRAALIEALSSEAPSPQSEAKPSAGNAALDEPKTPSIPAPDADESQGRTCKSEGGEA